MMWKYGPDLVGWVPTLQLVTLSLAKELLTWLFELSRTEKYFQSRRNFRPLTEELRKEGLEILKIIRRTPVPGWD